MDPQERNEVKDDTLQFSSDPPPAATTISIGPGGLSVESSPNTTPITTPETKTETTTTHPLLVLPMKFGAEPKFVLKVDSPESQNPNKESLGSTAPPVSKEVTQSQENQETSRRPAHHSSHSSILEKIQLLSLNTTPTTSGVTSPVTSPITTPKGSPTFNRKLIAMEPQRKISAHSYFCTKQYMEKQATTMSIKEELPPSGNPKRVDEASLPPQALDPKMMGQRRRHPKPSALREMNFWAPTSM